MSWLYIAPVSSTPVLIVFFPLHVRQFVAFVFKEYGNHQGLHSFPTRRSSDLGPRTSPPRRRSARESSSSTPCRSEEHTSELQSPCNLVCRLLLEKKKERVCVYIMHAAYVYLS